MAIDPFSLLLDPDAIMKTDLFLYVYSDGASKAELDVLDRFNVVSIILKTTPKHQFLEIHMEDSQDNGRTRRFILERMEEASIPATDRFLGENFVNAPEWAGQNVRQFNPKGLTLFKLALLAHVVHEYPTYLLFGSLVYDTIEQHFGSESAVETRGRVDPQVVSGVIDEYEKPYSEEIAQIMKEDQIRFKAHQFDRIKAVLVQD